jgi:hypothetical protein
MDFNITFGTRRVTRTGTFQKYSDQPVITVEGEKEAGKSRRMLFNKTAMDLMNLDEGSGQEILFGFVEQDEQGNRHLLIGNVTGVAGMSDEVTYTTSKNRIAFDDTKEKGKGLSSKVLMKEINDFLEVDKVAQHEYDLVPFAQPGMPEMGFPLFELVRVGTEVTQTQNDDLTPVEPINIPSDAVNAMTGEAVANDGPGNDIDTRNTQNEDVDF